MKHPTRQGGSRPFAGLVAAVLLGASVAPLARAAAAFAASTPAPPPVTPAAPPDDALADADGPAPTRAVATGLSAPGLDPVVLDLALAALDCAHRTGAAAVPEAEKVLSIIDYRLPSTAPRLWVLDLQHRSTLFIEHVAHGRGTGEDLATRFSNVPESNTSSVGLFRTGETYTGKHGLSLRLDGLEPGFNDQARARGIVVHGADYCTMAHVDTYGRLGRSQGCPALDPAISEAVIDTIRGGTLLFAYFPEADWLSTSRFMHCDAAPAG